VRTKRNGFMHVFLAVLSVAGAASAATVTLNPAIKYQTIDGFGGFGPRTCWYCGGPYWDSTWLRTVVDSMGATLIRNEYASEEAGQDANWATMSPWVKAVNDYARSKGEPLAWILSAWSPPSAMKDNGSLKNGGSLRTTSYDAYADWWVEAITKYRAIGAEVRAISMQNEPRFSEPYNSCIMLPPQYRDVLKIVAPKIKTASPSTLMFGPEDMLASGGYAEYVDAIAADAVAKPLFDVVAVHGYTDGVTPGGVGTAEIIRWSGMYNVKAKPRGYRTWQTETSGYTNDLNGAIQIAGTIQIGLRYAKLSGWTFWCFGDEGGDGGLLRGSAMLKSGYVHKQFARYIRPGAVGIDIKCSAPDSTSLFPTAFQDNQHMTLTIVLLNMASSANSVTLAGPNLPATLRMYRTSSSENCQDKGNVASNGAISIPASCLVTLVGTLTTSIQTSRDASKLRLSSGACSAQTRVCTISGRRSDALLSRQANTRALSHGVYVCSDRGSVLRLAR
jgi:glucuronoarabinoxylan endo-1,4-beta-xylanase